LTEKRHNIDKMQAYMIHIAAVCLIDFCWNKIVQNFYIDLWCM